MSVVAKGGNSQNFPNPPIGVHPGLCIDVIDLGDVETPYKDERTGKPRIAHQIQVVWQLQPEGDDGKPILRDDGGPFRISRFYTLSLNEKANLRADLEAWRGQPFTDEELADGFDVEKLILKQCQLNLVGKKNKAGKDVVIVKSISPAHRRDPKIVVDPEFKRELLVPGGRDVRSPAKDEEPEEPNLPEETEDDDLPF